MKLFVYNKSLTWPLRSGNNVHVFYLLREFIKHEKRVVLCTSSAPDPHIKELLPELEWTMCATDERKSHIKLSRLQKRLSGYWGVNEGDIGAVSSELEASGADVFIGCGLEVLPFLHSAPKATVRVWYAADDPILHHWSLMTDGKSTIQRLRPLLTTLLYKWCFRKSVDVSWVVSPRDAKWMRRIARIHPCAVLPNGVDFDYFKPRSFKTRVPNSCVFWGRLDFSPNIHALDWFLENVWPGVIASEPQATFSVVGMNASSDNVRRWEVVPGITIRGNIPDLRDVIPNHDVAVFPFHTGAGIKNKLLEGAAMGMPILATPLACNGLSFDNGLPFPIEKSPSGWTQKILDFFQQNEFRDSVGTACREWVTQFHSWAATSDRALASIRGAKTD
jgi:glycosyltransferase involved in cell wall biosynthesis